MEEVITQREIKALVIPDGIETIIAEGTPLRILREIGGNFTAITPWGLMVRIEGKDAPAIGKEVPKEATSIPEGDNLDQKIWTILKRCYDPEIPVNIVDLGLIYGVESKKEENGLYNVKVKMTLTAPGCGMGNILIEDIKRSVKKLPEVEDVEVEIMFDPPWTPDMMSDEAKLKLGFF